MREGCGGEGQRAVGGILHHYLCLIFFFGCCAMTNVIKVTKHVALRVILYKIFFFFFADAFCRKRNSEKEKKKISPSPNPYYHTKMKQTKWM